jgi:hypothetical protein
MVNAAMVNGGAVEFLAAAKASQKCVLAYETCIRKRG